MQNKSNILNYKVTIISKLLLFEEKSKLVEEINFHI